MLFARFFKMEEQKRLYTIPSSLVPSGPFKHPCCTSYVVEKNVVSPAQNLPLSLDKLRWKGNNNIFKRGTKIHAMLKSCDNDDNDHDAI